MTKQNLYIIPANDNDAQWHLHTEDCNDVNRYDYTSFNGRWTVDDATDARETLQHDWNYASEEEGIYDFDRNVKIFPCVKKQERVGA